METSTLVGLSVFSCTLFYIIGPTRFLLTMKIVYLLIKLFVFSTYTTLKKYTKSVFKPSTRVVLLARVSTPEEREMDLKRPKMRRPQTPQLIDKNQDEFFPVTRGSSVYTRGVLQPVVVVDNMGFAMNQPPPSTGASRDDDDTINNNVIPLPEDGTTVRESAAMLPTPESAALLPTPESVAMLPTPESVAMLPTSESAAMLPTPESAPLLLTPESAALLPTPESAAMLLTQESAAMLLTPESAALLPTPESAALLPTPESAALLPTRIDNDD